MQILEREVLITEKNPKKSKCVMYRITDSYIAFWHISIVLLLRMGSIGMVDFNLLWSEVVLLQVNDHMGDVFEKICREWVIRIHCSFALIRIGCWWDLKS